MNLFTPLSVKIAVLREDGGISVLAFQTRSRGHATTYRDGTPIIGLAWINRDAGIWARFDTDESIAQEIAHTALPSPAVSWQRITDGFTLHDDRDYRNALGCENGVLKHDIVRARERCREMLRGERANAMVRLDGDFMRVLGQKGPSQELGDIEAERQKWRDAPADPRIEAATTVEELKQIKVG